MNIPHFSTNNLSNTRGADRALFGSVGLLAVLLVQGVTAYSSHIVGLIH